MAVFSRLLIRPLLRRPSLSPQFHFRREFRPKRQHEHKSEPEPVRFEPVREEPPVSQDVPSSIGKYLLYTTVAVPTFFAGCAIWQYETVRKIVNNPAAHYRTGRKEMGFREQLNSIWNTLSPTRKLVVEIVAANTLIFFLWRLPPMVHFLSRYFLCMPTRAHSVLGTTLSAFSHHAGFHLFANMYVLWSFSGPLSSLLGKEQFFAVFLAGATVAGLTSSVYRILSRRLVPSLGASGGILSLIAIVCIVYPEARLSIAFVDQIFPHSFTAQSAIIGLIVLDIIGILRGWRFLDHAGHLGGVLFGLWYAKYGKTIVWDKYKQKLLKQWHKFRNNE